MVVCMHINEPFHSQEAALDQVWCFFFGTSNTMNIVLPYPFQDPGIPRPSFECSAGPPLHSFYSTDTSKFPASKWAYSILVWWIQSILNEEIGHSLQLMNSSIFILTLKLLWYPLSSISDVLSSSVLLPLWLHKRQDLHWARWARLTQLERIDKYRIDIYR